MVITTTYECDFCDSKFKYSGIFNDIPMEWTVLSLERKNGIGEIETEKYLLCPKCREEIDKSIRKHTRVEMEHIDI